MKYENIIIRIIGYDWDDLEELKESLNRFIKELDKEDKPLIEIRSSTGLVSDKLYTLEIKTSKNKVIKKILEEIIKRIEDKKEFLDYIKLRWENNVLYLRFDKDYFLRKDKLIPTEGGDVLYIRISFPGYMKRDEIIKHLEEKLNAS